MRNPVAHHDHNRAATHPDRSKNPPNTVDEGLLDYLAENAENVAQEEYERSEEVKKGALYEAKGVELYINGIKMDGWAEETRPTRRKKFPGLSFSRTYELKGSPLVIQEELKQLFASLEQPANSSV